MERWILDNGLTVLYRQDADFPLSTATLLFRPGSRQESRQEAGLCSMTVDLLMQGTRRKNASQIARVMESVGASMGTQAHQDYAEMGFVVPASEIERALGLTAEVLHEPSFPPDEIIKEKAHVLASLASRRDAIFNLAYDHVNHALYGSHPYGRPVEGSIDAVKTFRRSDFQGWHRDKIRPEYGVLSLVAPLSGKMMLGRLQRTIGKWRQPKTPFKSALPVATIHALTKSESKELRSSFEQAYLMVGWQVHGAAHRDQIPLKVLNALMGGGMSSRLFVTLRENLGLAYEVSSFYPTRLDTSQWLIYLGLPSEKLATASKKLNELLKNLAQRGPSADELQHAKAMIRGAFLMDRQSRRRQAWYAAWWEFLGRDEHYAVEFLTSVDAVTLKTVHGLAKRILEQPRVTVTVVPK